MKTFTAAEFIFISILLKTSESAENERESTDGESDMYNYKDELYTHLEEEYIDTLVKEMDSTTKKSANELYESGHQRIPHEPRVKSTTAKDFYTREREFLERTKILQCDNPWFWNTFECTVLDIKNRHHTKRLKSNAAIAGSIIGVIVFILSGSIFALYCYAKIKFGLLFKKFQTISKKYSKTQKPGIIKLPKFSYKDGIKSQEMHTYKPTQEEIDALENLLEVLATVN